MGLFDSIKNSMTAETRANRARAAIHTAQLHSGAAPKHLKYVETGGGWGVVKDTRTGKAVIRTRSR